MKAGSLIQAGYPIEAGCHLKMLLNVMATISTKWKVPVNMFCFVVYSLWQQQWCTLCTEKVYYPGIASWQCFINTPVTPNGNFTATFGDFKFGLVAGGRCVVALNRRLAVTPEHRSQQIAANRPTVLRLYSDCTATVQRLKEIVCDRS